MLTERERRELEIIERQLSSDPRLAALARKHRRPFLRRLVSPSSLMAFGALVMVIAVALGLGETFAQGLGLTILGLGWWSWTAEAPRRSRAPRRATPRR
jgi:hypothetical protein